MALRSLEHEIDHKVRHGPVEDSLVAFPSSSRCWVQDRFVIPIFSYAASAATVQPSAKLSPVVQVLHGGRTGAANKFLNDHRTNWSAKIGKDGAVRTRRTTRRGCFSTRT